MGAEKWYHKIASAQESAGKEIERIRREGKLSAHSVGGASAHDDTGAIRRGEYVPEAELVKICLECERKSCTGYCKAITAAKKEIRDRNKRNRELKERTGT